MALLAVMVGCQSRQAPEDDGTSPAKGIWLGEEFDRSHDQRRYTEGVVLPSGIWMLASYGEAHDRRTDRPAAVAFGVLAAGDRQLSADGQTYGPGHAVESRSMQGRFLRDAELALDYLRFEPGEPPRVMEEGELLLSSQPHFHRDADAPSLAGDYRNAELSLRIGAAGQIAGISAGGQAGYCNFTGLLGAEDDRFNAYWGVMDLGDDPGCELGGDNADQELLQQLRQFEAVAYRVRDRHCEQISGDHEALVLALHNGRVAHYYHRLCRH